MDEVWQTMKKISADTIAVQGALLASVILADDFTRAMDTFPLTGQFEYDTIVALTAAYLALFCCFICICSLIAQVVGINRELMSTAMLNKFAFVLSLILYIAGHGIFFWRFPAFMEWCFAVGIIVLMLVLYLYSMTFDNQDHPGDKALSQNAQQQERLSVGSEIMAAVILVDDLSRAIDIVAVKGFNVHIFFALCAGYLALMTCLMAMVNADCLGCEVMPHKSQLAFPGITALMTLVTYTLGQAMHMYQRKSLTAFAIMIYTQTIIVIIFFMLAQLSNEEEKKANSSIEN